MKENREWERPDLAIDPDMDVDCDMGQEITAYIETWFDADKKFRIDTASEDGTWVNMYAKYNPFADTLRIECEISSDNGSSYFDYEPTAAETRLIQNMMVEKIRQVYGRTPKELCEDFYGDRSEAVELETGRNDAMTQYIYPQNLKATANLWLWGLKDFVILAVAALLSVLALVQLRILLPAAATLCYGFLTIRMDDTTVLDFMRYAVRYFISTQQYFEWR